MSSDSWVFGVPSYTITDGDLPCLETGQDVDFPVELQPTPAWTAAARPEAALGSHPLEGNTREFVAEVLELGEGTWIVDLGLRVCGQGDWPLVYAGREMPEVMIGDRFIGQGSFVVHALGTEIDLPYGGVAPPRYKWRIEGIERDGSQPVSVERTRASEGFVDYLLHCSLLSRPYA
jgi:hypothetical protein